MQPRFRSLVWREMPPCVRRLGIAWSRRLLYAELFLGRLYLSLTKSPTWNFVAIVGTLGILLTILLFLAPWIFPAKAELTGIRRAQSASQPAWELDARLASYETVKDDKYPVELLAATTTRHRSRNADVAEEPIQTFATRTRKTAVAKTPSFDQDWFDSEKEEKEETARAPELGMEVEVVVARKRSRREPVVAETVWEGRSSPMIDLASRRLRPDRRDPWTVTDPRHLARAGRHTSDFFDDETIPASHADRPIGSAWQPIAFPRKAPATSAVSLELSWNRRTTRQRSDPKLMIRNLGDDSIARMDVLSGPLPDFDLSSTAELLTQSISELLPQAEDSVSLPLSKSGRRSRLNLVSVLITTFVGGTTQVIEERIEPVAKLVEPEVVPVPRRKREAPREPDRPHLSMTVGKPGRLPLEKMVSVPIHVVNDGNVPLTDVVILATIPAPLEHEYGRHVHYRLGRLEPGQERQSTLLLTPLEAGAATVPLQAIDGNRLASADGEADVQVSEEEYAEVRVRRSRLRRQAATEKSDDFGDTPQ